MIFYVAVEKNFLNIEYRSGNMNDDVKTNSIFDIP